MDLIIRHVPYPGRSPGLAMHRRSGLHGSCRGFTLVELMVTLSLLAVVLVSGVALTSGWVDDARINEGGSQMETAYAKARAAAIKNSTGSTGTAAAVLCINSGVVYVHTGIPGTCGQNSLWNATLAGGTGTQVKNADASALFNCIGIGNRGYQVSTVVASAPCTSTILISINRGGKSVQKNLFVPPSSS